MREKYQESSSANPTHMAYQDQESQKSFFIIYFFIRSYRENLQADYNSTRTRLHSQKNRDSRHDRNTAISGLNIIKTSHYKSKVLPVSHHV